jgi:signal transduction histidine kinase
MRDSIRLRLMALATLIVVCALVGSGIILHALFVTNLERSVQADLEGAMSRIIALIDPQAPEPALLGTLPDPRYETPLGGRYWQVRSLDSGAILSSRSLFEQQLDPVEGDGQTTLHYEDAAGHHLILINRDVEIGERRYQVTVGQDHDPIHRAGERYASEIAQLFGLLGIAIIIASWMQLRLGLSPLMTLRSGVDAIRSGEVQHLSGRYPSEISPLVDEVNALLVEREKMAERARRRASDLAHGLKTPLAALQGIAMRLRERGEDAEAFALNELATEMSERIDYQMRLAALRTRAEQHRESSSLNTAVLRTMAVLRKTERGESLNWLAQLGDDLQVDIHRQDLMELVGVMLENACKWADTRVLIESARHGDLGILAIEDDGPGIASDLRDRIGSRGMRLDESMPGTGLGLAIATEIIDLNSGTITYSEGRQGGLRVEMRLALSKP